MKNEVKKKMTIQLRKLLHQSHDDRVFDRKCQEDSCQRIERFSISRPHNTSSRALRSKNQTDNHTASILLVSPMRKLLHDPFLFFSIYNENREIFAGA